MDTMGTVERRGAVRARAQVMAVVMACLAWGCAQVQPELAQVSQPPGASRPGSARALIQYAPRGAVGALCIDMPRWLASPGMRAFVANGGQPYDWVSAVKQAALFLLPPAAEAGREVRGWCGVVWAEPALLSKWTAKAEPVAVEGLEGVPPARKLPWDTWLVLPRSDTLLIASDEEACRAIVESFRRPGAYLRPDLAEAARELSDADAAVLAAVSPDLFYVLTAAGAATWPEIYSALRAMLPSGEGTLSGSLDVTEYGKVRVTGAYREPDTATTHEPGTWASFGIALSSPQLLYLRWRSAWRGEGLPSDQETSWESEGRVLLRGIARGLRAHAHAHEGRYPPDLRVLLDEGYLGSEWLVNEHGDVFTRGTFGFLPAFLWDEAYTFRYVGALPPHIVPNAIVAYSPKGYYPHGRNCLRVDNAVEFRSERELSGPDGLLMRSYEWVLKSLRWEELSDERAAELRAFYEVDSEAESPPAP